MYRKVQYWVLRTLRTVIERCSKVHSKQWDRLFNNVMTQKLEYILFTKNLLETKLLENIFYWLIFNMRVNLCIKKIVAVIEKRLFLLFFFSSRKIKINIICVWQIMWKIRISEMLWSFYLRTKDNTLISHRFPSKKCPFTPKNAVFYLGCMNLYR